MTGPADLAKTEWTKAAQEVAAEISERLRAHHRTVAVAESLTSGSISGRLGAAAEASKWFAGGVVAYASQVKFEVLGVDPGPVITATCARQMADGVARLTSADFAVAVTGAGGPDPEEGQPAGTVFVAIHTPVGTSTTAHRFDGEPEVVVQLATLEALKSLLGSLTLD